MYVGFVGVQGVHVVEFGIEGEVVGEVVVEERMGLVSVVGFVEGEAVEELAERHWRGPSKGSSVQGGPAHFFYAALSPLFLLLFKLVVVSMGGSNASVLVRAVLALGFFFDRALVTGSTGCSIMLSGISAVTDVGMYWGDVLLAGEAVAVADLSSAFMGDFLFFLVTSVQPSSAFLGWT